MMVLQQHSLDCESLTSEKGTINILENGNQGCAEDMGSQGVRMEGKTPKDLMSTLLWMRRTRSREQRDSPKTT